ncbi:MAG: hypothetical protein GC178_09425 [Flavobacteriales bacterium]|nr:hypothetical protein [Flavobacteriales bacterium]
MAAQDDLFQLIQSLNPSEKRYFKVNASKGGDSKSNYLQLFEALDGLDEYDEAAFKKKHAKKPFIKYLSAEKKQLRGQIMKQMRSFHGTRTIDTAINELLQDELFYMDKGLFDHREKALLKAKELATKYERYHLLKEIIHRQIAHTTEFEKKQIINPVLELINEQKAIAILEDTYTDLTIKNGELFTLYRSGSDINSPSVKNRADSLINDVERYRSRIGVSFRLNSVFNRAHGNYNHLFKNRQAAFEASLAEYELYQQFSFMKDEESKNYKICLENLISRALTSKNYDWYLKALEEMKTVPVTSFDEEGEVFQNVYFQEHFYYINIGEFEKAASLVPTIENGLITYQPKINKARVLAFQFNIMVMYFIMHRFKDALRWMNPLLADNSEIKQQQKFVTLLLQPIIHFELGHEDLVESYTRSAYRFIQKKERLHRFEKIVLKYFQQMPFNSSHEMFNTNLEQLIIELNQLSMQKNHESVLGMEEIELWAKSHLTGQKMINLLRSR